MAEFQERSQAPLGDDFNIERELGGGGISGSRSSFAAVVCAMTIAACAHQSRSESGAMGERDTVTGTIAYRERIALPPKAVAEISLIDATAASTTSPPVTSTAVARATVQSKGTQIPLPFSLHF
ncbi:MAG: YbaY family lipoprotein, partial [Gemmatimonadota bacterium]